MGMIILWLDEIRLIANYLPMLKRKKIFAGPNKSQVGKAQELYVLCATPHAKLNVLIGIK